MQVCVRGQAGGVCVHGKVRVEDSWGGCACVRARACVHVFIREIASNIFSGFNAGHSAVAFLEAHPEGMSVKS